MPTGTQQTKESALYFMTGSSGSGKTTLLRRVVADFYPNLHTGHVDAPGAPQGGRAWVERAARPQAPAPRLLVVDGQERPHLVLAAVRELRLSAFHLVLIDCDHAERRRRLLEDRRAPELDRLDIYAWAAYLRGQADALGLEILDTTAQSLEASVLALADSIAQFARRAGLDLSDLTPQL